MTLLERIRKRHETHEKSDDIQTRLAWAHSDRADLLEMLADRLAIVTCGACGSETATSNHLAINKKLAEATARADAEMKSNHRLIARNLELENLIDSYSLLLSLKWYI